MEGSLSIFGVVLIIVIVLLLPGLAWLVLFQDRDLDPLEQLAEAIGVSIAVTAIIALGFFLAEWKLSTTGLVGIYAALLVVIVGGLAYRKISPHQPIQSEIMVNGQQPGEFGVISTRTARVIPPWIVFALLGGILSLIIAFRLYQVQNLVVPSWVDSVHHVVIIQAFLENRGLPNTLDPTCRFLYYHYTLPCFIAAFSALAQVPIPVSSVDRPDFECGCCGAIYRLGRRYGEIGGVLAWDCSWSALYPRCPLIMLLGVAIPYLLVWCSSLWRWRVLRISCTRVHPDHAWRR
jgi:hypothetical protein